jgi:hypothetical protein
MMIFLGFIYDSDIFEFDLGAFEKRDMTYVGVDLRRFYLLE